MDMGLKKGNPKPISALNSIEAFLYF